MAHHFACTRQPIGYIQAREHGKRCKWFLLSQSYDSQLIHAIWYFHVMRFICTGKTLNSGLFHSIPRSCLPMYFVRLIRKSLGSFFHFSAMNLKSSLFRPLYSMLMFGARMFSRAQFHNRGIYFPMIVSPSYLSLQTLCDGCSMFTKYPNQRSYTQIYIKPSKNSNNNQNNMQSAICIDSI